MRRRQPEVDAAPPQPPTLPMPGWCTVEQPRVLVLDGERTVPRQRCDVCLLVEEWVAAWDAYGDAVSAWADKTGGDAISLTKNIPDHPFCWGQI